MGTRDFSGEDVYTVLINVGNFEHVNGDQTVNGSGVVDVMGVIALYSQL